MINVLYLITGLHIGGTEKVVFETVCRLDRGRYHPVVVGLKKEGEYARRLRARGIPTLSLDLYDTPVLFPFKLAASFARLASLVKKEKINVIHSFLFQANLLGKFLGAWCAVPVITSFRVMEEEKRWQLVLDRMTRGLSSAVVVNSLALRDFVSRHAGVPASKVTVVYNGIDAGSCPRADRSLAEREASLTGTDVIVTAAVRLHEQKGLRYLVEAARLLKDRADEDARSLKFIVIGDGPQRAALEKMSRDAGVDDRVRFLGWRNDTLELIAASDIVVLPSLWEGTPNVILEAMACARPVVATRVGGVPELVEDGISGSLVPPRDPAALAGSLLRLAKDGALRETMGKRAREKAYRSFSMGRMVNDFELMYDGIVNKERGNNAS